MATSRAGKIYGFKISLRYIEPEIWRVIEVPERYSFWDLHVAIQDAMGWLDYHLHAFCAPDRDRRKLTPIGIPEGDLDEQFLPGWEVSIKQLFEKPGDILLYQYDFGDNWEHDVTLLAISPREKGVKYPRCVDGARACPPEDCGGIGGYAELLKTLKRGSGTKYKEMVWWLENHAVNYWPYDPDAFDPAAVKFRNPKKRLDEITEEY